MQSIQAGRQPADPITESWLEVLGAPADGEPGAAGFISSGGNSLRAARLVGLLARRCGAEIPLPPLLRNISLAELRELVRNAPRRAAAETASALLTGSSTSPLAPEQRKIWLTGRLHPASSAYNVIAALRLHGRLDTAALQHSLDVLLERHDLLRAHIAVADDGEPYWVYAPEAALPIAIEVVQGRLAQEAMALFVRTRASEPIPDSAAPLARAALLRSATHDEACLVFVFNHLIADQTTADLLLGELAALYSAEVRGEPADLPPAPAYAAYAHRAASRPRSAEHARDLDYWCTALAGLPTELALPFRRPRPPVPAFCGEPVERLLGPDLLARLDQRLREHGLTSMSFLLACIATVLAAWSGHEDVPLGVPVSRRSGPMEHDLAGFLLDTLPLRVRVSADATVWDLAARASERYAEAVAHSTPGFDAIVEALGVRSTPDRNPVFQVWVNDLTGTGRAPDFAGLRTRHHPQPMVAALFDLGWYLWPDDGGHRLQLVRDTALFDAEVAEELIDQVLRVMRQALADPAQQVGTLSLGAPRAEPGGEWPARPAPAPRDEPLTRIRSVAGRSPDATAIVAGPVRIGYRELVEAVDRAAAALASHEVPEHALVELQAERNAAFPVALLGVWAHGARPLIIDASATPPGRLRAIRDSTGPAAVVVGNASAPAADEPIGVRPLPLPAGPPPAKRLSHVLLTSGTSGAPPAVRVPHGALANFISWYMEEFGIGPADRFALLAGVGHDPVLRDVLVPLSAGAELHVPAPEVFADPAALTDWLRRGEITVLHVTPALLEILLAALGRTGAVPARQRLDRLRLVVCAGAPLTAGLARRLRRHSGALLVNAYGTTETPQIAACQSITDDFLADPAVTDESVLPVGTGVAGHRVVVLTPAGAVAAPGQRGEVVVAGRHLAAGYLREEPGPAERFRRCATDPPGVRRFHTGDRGYTDLAGRVVVTGRTDRQVSLDGFRLELGEVESAALAHPRVRQALALLRRTPAGAVLALQVVAEPGTSPAELRSWLDRALPPFAAPSLIETVERLGITANHKAAPAPPGMAATPVQPARNSRTGVDPRVAALAEEVVGHPIGPDENFFDAGMTSLALVRFHELLERELAVELPITMLFTRVTLRTLTKHLEGGGQAAEPVVPPAPSGARTGVEPRDLSRLAEARRSLRDRIQRSAG